MSHSNLFARVSAVACVLALSGCSPVPRQGQLGEPIAGLTPEQAEKFSDASLVFAHEFSVKEGLGPLYNARSCAACHDGAGVAGGAGSNQAEQGFEWFASRRNPNVSKAALLQNATTKDVHFYENEGMGLVEKNSITQDSTTQELTALPKDCRLDRIGIPAGCDYTSKRIAPPLFGLGFVNAIPDALLDSLEQKQSDLNIDLAGRALDRKDRLTFRERINRFGYKCLESNLFLMTADMMNEGIGVTTPASPKVRCYGTELKMPQCLKQFVPDEPNDQGSVQAKLTYFVSLLAPPARAEITPAVKHGEQVFQKLGCAFCHIPELRTAAKVEVVDPTSPAPDLRYIEIKSLENQPVRAYSDFLVHEMGPALADGVPEGKASAGEWRTTPLWGLRFKKCFLHDGRCKSLSSAIEAHGGQAALAQYQYAKLPEKDRADLMAFLESL